MLTLPLDPTDDRANPIFKDAAGCARWLSQLQLTNLQRAHEQLLAQITEFNSYPMRGLERLSTLELLRETAEHLQHDFSKKLIGKPLPLNEGELKIFSDLLQLWQALVVGYQRCLQAYMAGDKALSAHGSLLCQRCLHYTGQEIFEHIRTGYAVNSVLWHQLHELYAYAEREGLQQTEVSDPLMPEQLHSNCVNSYVKTLLACHACPAELTRSQLQQLEHWLSLWSNEVPVQHSYRPSKADAQPLAADLSSAQGLQPVAGLPASDALRYLVMAPLSKLLRVKIILLRQGQTPDQAGLGDHYDVDACIELLTFLHLCWCANNRKRATQRQPLASHAHVCYAIEGIYARLTGKPYQPQAAQPSHDSLARQIETLGHAPQPVADSAPSDTPLETWQIEDESIAGACLTREGSGCRLGCRQLLALRPSDATRYMLCTTIWVSVTRQGRLQTGVKYLPGQVEALLIRSSGINPSFRQTCTPALLLLAMPAINSPASLVIPRSWFQASRVIECEHQDGRIFKARLGFSVENGMDYERVSFTAL